MKEIKCDCCGKVIRAYYPYDELVGTGSDHNPDIDFVDQIKTAVDWILSVDCKWGWEPVEYHFCSVECLKKHADVIDNQITYARENKTWKRREKYGKA